MSTIWSLSSSRDRRPAGSSYHRAMGFPRLDDLSSRPRPLPGPDQEHLRPDPVLEADIAEQCATRPDAHIFASLPRSGKVRAAKLLAEIGDTRGRYPTADALAALAGACPSTRASGRHHVVSFRRAYDKKLRDAVMDFAGDSRHASPWAAAIYDRHRDCPSFG